MSKRNRGRRYSYSDKPRQMITEKRDIAREQEILNRPMADFQNTVIEQMLKRIADPSCSDVEAFNIGMALQGFIRGPAALSANMDNPQVAEYVAKALEQREKIDAAARAFEEDKLKFAEEMARKADQVRPTGERLDKTIAAGVGEYQTAKERAMAERNYRRLQLRYRIENDPKEEIDVVPEYENVRVNDVITARPAPIVVHIMDIKYPLKPGRQFVPRIIANAYRQRRRLLDENIARRSALRANTEAYKLEQAMARIDQEYNASRDRVMIPQEV